MPDYRREYNKLLKKIQNVWNLRERKERIMAEDGGRPMETYYIYKNENKSTHTVNEEQHDNN